MRVLVRGVRLFFDVEGAALMPAGNVMREKPVMILLHGGPGFDHSGFKPGFAQLRDLVQVIYLDLRGCGRSDRGDAEKWTLEEWSADLKVFCETLEICEPILFGQSFGGYVALKFASRFPAAVHRLILSSTTAKLRIDRALTVFERLGGSEARAAAEGFWSTPTRATYEKYARLCLPLYSVQPAPAEAMQLAKMNLPLMFHYFAPGNEGRTFDLHSSVSAIQCPTLILAGTDDPITTIDDARDLAAQMPAHLVRLAEFEGCRHGLSRDAPERLFSLMREFIQQ